MLKAKDFRQRAWSKLHGNWTPAVVAYLIMDLILGVCAFTYAGPLILSGPLSVGFSFVAINYVRRNNPQIENLFASFRDFGRTFLLYLINNIFIALWSLLFIIPGIIKSLSYSMSYFILIDDINISANEARKRSMELMNGNKWRLFCLNFSFLGWILLSILTLGILFFWVMPYMEVARAEFYQSLISQNAEQAPPRQKSAEVFEIEDKKD